MDPTKWGWQNSETGLRPIRITKAIITNMPACGNCYGNDCNNKTVSSFELKTAISLKVWENHEYDDISDQTTDEPPNGTTDETAEETTDKTTNENTLNDDIFYDDRNIFDLFH